MMLSELEAMIAGCMVEGLAVLGLKTFSIGNATYSGNLDQLGNRSYSIVTGGREVAVSAHLLCLRAQFGPTIPTAGTRLRIGTDLFVIASFSSDAVNVTFTLADPDEN
jgi:hypothetical protein